MKRMLMLAALAATLACSTSEPAPQPAATAAPPPAAAGSAAGGRVAGKVHASGAAVVVLAPKSESAFPTQNEKPVIDQVGLTFGPEMLFVRTGQPVEFRNSDDTLHNVNVKHEESREQAFNVAIPTGGNFEHTFARDGFYRVSCDIHPAMTASIFEVATPFTALAAPDGSFEFSDVAPCAWTITVYTGGKRLHKDVEVTRGVTEVTLE